MSHGFGISSGSPGRCRSRNSLAFSAWVVMAASVAAARDSRRPWCLSAGDLKVVADVGDSLSHPRGAYHRVVFCPGADMAGQRDDAVLGLRLHITVVRDERGTLKGLLDVQVDVDGIDDVADVDVVFYVAATDQTGNGRFRRRPPTGAGPPPFRPP